MQEIIILNQVPVEILYYGGISPTQMLETKIQDRPKELVLFIPGCPGIIQDYSRFGDALEAKLKKPMWFVGYGGFSKDVPLSIKPRTNRHLYDMLAQVRQKKELILRYLEGVSVSIIAHSFGCCLTLECMKDDSLSKQFNAMYFIFPFFQDMEKLEVGIKASRVKRIVKNLLRYFQPIFEILFKSPKIRRICAGLLSHQLESPQSENIPNLIHIDVIWSFIANIECILDYLKGEPYNKILMENSRKIKIWLTKGDEFQTETFCENIKKRIPGLWAEYINLDIPHSFHKHHSKELADALSSMIESDKLI